MDNRFKLEDIKSVVFSGGGSRCLWQAGVWTVLSQKPNFKPSTIAAASAGATMVSLLLTGNAEKGLDYFKEVTAKNRKNAYWSHVFSKKPVFPHFEIYKTAILDLIEEDDLKKLKTAPEVRVMISQPPPWLGPRSGSFVGILSYSLEKFLRYPMHPSFSRKLGYRSQMILMSQCSTVKELADLLLQSSCTPPFVPVMKRNGMPVLDGGLIDNVPVNALADRPGLKFVLLSRQYPANKIPKYDDRFYFQPSESITVNKWDYTNPGGLQFAYDLGKKDAVNLLNSLDAS